MSTVHVHLQEGFDGEPVILRLDGRVVANRATVRTRQQLGLAEIIQLDTSPGHHELEVVLPARNRVQTIPFDLQQELHLGLNLESDGVVTHRISQSTFGYV
ncbi:MAG: hypothetical protein ACJ8BF_13835 [Gemmatimonadales bacterium]